MKARMKALARGKASNMNKAILLFPDLFQMA